MHALDFPTEDWEGTFSVNLAGAFLCAKHAIPHLMAQANGRVINTAPVALFPALDEARGITDDTVSVTAGFRL